MQSIFFETDCPVISVRQFHCPVCNKYKLASLCLHLNLLLETNSRTLMHMENAYDMYPNFDIKVADYSGRIIGDGTSLV